MKLENLSPADLLPHKAPMLLVDRVVESDFKSTVTVETDVKKEAFYFKGHFPNYPLLPGVVILEMMFQTCGILNRLRHNKGEVDKNKKRMGKAVKIKSATFYKEVLPNSVIKIKARRKGGVLNFSDYEVLATVNGNKVCESDLTVVI